MAQPNNSYLSKAIPCRLNGYTHGTLNAWAYPGKYSTQNWIVESTCGKVSIQVGAGLAESRVDCLGLPDFYYE